VGENDRKENKGVYGGERGGTIEKRGKGCFPFHWGAYLASEPKNEKKKAAGKREQRRKGKLEPGRWKERKIRKVPLG